MRAQQRRRRREERDPPNPLFRPSMQSSLVMELFRANNSMAAQLYNQPTIIYVPVAVTPRRPTPEEELDEFLMYTYKVKRCSKTRSHDWTTCPYAHRGEKARRRDPRKFPYHGISCPEFRASGECRRGQNCEYAHGVFEFWLHPTRFHTRVCEAGLACARPICFFAHTPDELRPEVIRDCFHCNLHGHAIEGDGPVPAHACPVASATAAGLGAGAGASTGASTSTSGVAMRAVNNGRNVEEEQFDLPNIDWIVEMVK